MRLPEPGLFGWWSAVLAGEALEPLDQVPERTSRAVFGSVLVLSGIQLAGVPEANHVIAVAPVVVAPALGASLLRRLQRLHRIAAREAT
jgi:hypothetical protein